MGNFISDDRTFHWEYTETPHIWRRVAMIKKYPQLKSLMKSDGDRQLVLLGAFLVIIHVTLTYISFRLNFVPLSIFYAVTGGSLLASSIFMQVHECGHGLIFGPNSVWKNRMYGLFLNLALGFPVFAFFKKHHKSHHKYQGEADLDIEYAIESELNVFKGPLGKYTWVMLNPFLQMWRSTKCKTKDTPPQLTLEDVLSISTSTAVNIWLIRMGCAFFVFLLFLSNIAALATTFIGYWGISVHTEFFHMEETRNYVGFWNNFLLNLGLHVEHHDFPNIPARLLPKINKIAPDYYEDVHVVDSMITPIIKFVFDPKYGVFSRLKRNSRHA